MLIKADDKIDLLEYAVQAMLLGQLDVHFGLRRPTAVRYRRIDPLLPSVVGLLSILAYAGQEDEADVRQAFEKGMAEVGRSAALPAKLDFSLSQLDEALKRLAEAAPKLKRDILRACVACVAADGNVTPARRSTRANYRRCARRTCPAGRGDYKRQLKNMV